MKSCQFLQLTLKITHKAYSNWDRQQSHPRGNMRKKIMKMWMWLKCWINALWFTAKSDKIVWQNSFVNHFSFNFLKRASCLHAVVIVSQGWRASVGSAAAFFLFHHRPDEQQPYMKWQLISNCKIVTVVALKYKEINECTSELTGKAELPAIVIVCGGFDLQ